MAQSYNYIELTGVITPDYAIIRQEVVNLWISLFGADLNTDPETPQGVLIDMMATERYSVAINNATLANQINPDISGGIFLDSTSALTGLYRVGAVYSTAIVTLSGQGGTNIPTDVIISNTNGDLFQLVSTVTIPNAPPFSVDGLFKALEPGPIAAPPGTLNQIKNGVIGLETVTNPNAAVIGQNAESDQVYRLLRRLTLFRQAQSVSGAVFSALNALIVNDTRVVKSSSYRDNVKSTTEVIDGVTMNPHSIYVCVDTDPAYYNDVATAIYNKKSAGSDYTNNASSFPHSISVTDPFSMQVSNVLFDTPDIIDVLIKVTVSQGTYTGNLSDAIKKAIIKYADGGIEGLIGFVIGNPVSCFEISGAILREVVGIYLHNVQTSLVTPISYSNAEIPISIFEKAFTQESAITVNII